MNKIYTDTEYMAQGFTQEECPLIREHDELFNRWDELNEVEKERVYELAEILGL